MAPLIDIPENIHRYLLEEEKAVLPSGCLICGNAPICIGLIKKSNPNRMLIYCLFGACYENPTSDNAVEQIISYYETARNNNPDLLEHYGEC